MCKKILASPIYITQLLLRQIIEDIRYLFSLWLINQLSCAFLSIGIAYYGTDYTLFSRLIYLGVQSSKQLMIDQYSNYWHMLTNDMHGNRVRQFIVHFFVYIWPTDVLFIPLILHYSKNPTLLSFSSNVIWLHSKCICVYIVQQQKLSS